jgi:glyoxylase-like metal-dependent hydrolase (beta-lactamase superfamily II)
MYRVGFGDCFLMSVPQEKGQAHILVDCGVHARGDIGTIQAAVDDIGVETGGKLALVIATHAHQDHISGFAACETSFLKFDVGEVWLPWTENPKDPAAVKLKNKQTALTETVVRHFAARPPHHK